MRRRPILSAIALVGALLFGGLQAGRSPARSEAVLLEFWSITCPGCAQMEPVIEQLRQRFPVQRVNCDRDVRPARQWRVPCIPTYILVAGGREVGRIVGPATYDELAALCRQAGGWSQGSAGGLPLPGPEPWTPSIEPDEDVPASADQAAAADAPGFVVRVAADCSDGTQNVGSGSIIAADGERAIVATAQHVIRGARSVRVLAGGTWQAAEVLAEDPLWDAAFLKIATPEAGVERIEIAASDPRVGDVVTLAGLGPTGEYRSVSGRIVQFVAPGRGEPTELADVGAAVRQGDSGGPAWDAEGRWVGIVSSGDDRTVVVCLARLRRQLAEVQGAEEDHHGDTEVAETGGRDEGADALTPGPSPASGRGEDAPVTPSPPHPVTPSSSVCPVPAAADDGEEPGLGSVLAGGASWGLTALLAALGISVPPTAVYWGVRVGAAVVRRRREKKAGDRRPETGGSREEPPDGGTTSAPASGSLLEESLRAELEACGRARTEQAARIRELEERLAGTPPADVPEADPPKFGLGWSEDRLRASSVTRQRNRYVRVTETDLEAEAYKEALASWAEMNPRTAGFCRSIDELAANILHGKHVARRMTPAPDNPQIVPTPNS